MLLRLNKKFTIGLQKIENPYHRYKDVKNSDFTSSFKNDVILIKMSLPKLLNETWAMFEWNIGYGGLEVDIKLTRETIINCSFNQKLVYWN